VNATPWFPALVSRHPDLFRAIYDWNAYPHRWALPAWLESIAVPTPVVALLEQTARGRERLGRHFRQALGLDAMLWDFVEPRRRLALLTAPTLSRLARFAGAALHAAPLARVVTKADRRRVADHIGEDAYAFALRRGLARTLPELSAMITSDGDPLPHIETAGWHAVFASLSGEPAAVTARVRLKMPPAIAALPAFATPTEAPSATASWAFIQPILREAATPAELRCFA
jgi:hypothetical protein